MSFLTTLNTCCAAYAAFSYDGHSIQLPYKNGKKNTPDAIKAKISAWAGSSKKTASEIQKYVTDHPDQTGVDCSGLVYYALNEASSGAVKTYFEGVFPNDKPLSYANGVLASHLSNEAYGTKITVANDIKPGCTIRSDGGKHVLVIHSVNRNSAGNVTSIVYAHSNSSKGPHHAYIDIGDPTKDLDDASQTWHDIAYTDAVAKGYYNYTVLLAPIANLV